MKSGALSTGSGFASKAQLPLLPNLRADRTRHGAAVHAFPSEFRVTIPALDTCPGYLRSCVVRAYHCH